MMIDRNNSSMLVNCVGFDSSQGRTERSTMTRALKRPNNISSIFFNGVNLLTPKKTLGSNMGPPNLFFFPWRHLTSTRP